MNELSNTINAAGTYDDTPISLTSNTNVVKIIDGLTLKLEADKKYWKDGNLKYSITLDNATDVSYTTVTLTDVLDTTYISFVDGSVEIDGAKATSSQYSYNEASHTLTVNLDSVAAQGNTMITFEVKKK